MITKDVSKAPEKLRQIVAELNFYFEKDDTLRVSFPIGYMQVILSDGTMSFMTGRWDSPDETPFDRRVELLARYLGIKAEIQEGAVVFQIYLNNQKGKIYADMMKDIDEDKFRADSMGSWPLIPAPVDTSPDDVVPDETPLEQRIVKEVKEVIVSNGYIFMGHKTPPQLRDYRIRFIFWYGKFGGGRNVLDFELNMIEVRENPDYQIQVLKNDVNHEIKKIQL